MSEDPSRRPAEDATREVAAVRAGDGDSGGGSLFADRPDDASVDPGAPTGEAQRAEGEAYIASVHEDSARADARRAEEAADEARRRAEAAAKAEEEAHEREDRVQREADEARRRAEGAERSAGASESVFERDPSVGAVAAGGLAYGGAQPIVFGPFTAERPELLVAAAFVGAFLFARILKRITS